MVTRAVEVKTLRQAPDAVPFCVRWLNDEWGRGMGFSRVETEEWLRQIIKVDSKDIALIASQGGQPVGVCLLVECDLDLRVDLTPWLSSLFVLPEHRHNGTGRKLVGGIEAAARKSGVESLFLYTLDRETFYAELCWITVERLQLAKGEFALMRKRL